MMYGLAILVVTVALFAHAVVVGRKIDMSK